MPDELRALRCIDRYGAAAVFGRPLTVAEMNRMTATERVIVAYQSRAKAVNWAEWTEQHEDDAKLLAYCVRLQNAHHD